MKLLEPDRGAVLVRKEREIGAGATAARAAGARTAARGAGAQTGRGRGAEQRTAANIVAVLAQRVSRNRTRVI